MSSLIHQGRATYAFFERNWNLTRRYLAWEIVWLVYNIVNAMSITFIGVGVPDANYVVLYLLIGTAVWTYLSVTFDGVTDIINMERWEGTIEYTFMAPISRFTHMVGSCLYAIVHGLLFTLVQLIIVASFFHLDLSHANYLTAVFMLVLGSISFIGFGIATAILPLLFTEKGMQMTLIVKSILLLVSGVYYSVSVLPAWMRVFSYISPATYVLEGMRAGLLHDQPIWSTEIWSYTWPLLLSGVISIPVGVFVFGIAERYAKRTGRLKRNG